MPQKGFASTGAHVITISEFKSEANLYVRVMPVENHAISAAATR
jgi:hypothetical protein